jgi:LAO/AO transport system kinase
MVANKARTGLDPMELADRVLQGDRLSLARLLSQIEDEQAEGLKALSALFPHTGKAWLIGITGAPGTGKSTLVNQLALMIRQEGLSGSQPRVAIVAVDPSSPYTGGAILGDRIRMRDLAGDQGIFIRSMASRGALGGLARATSGVVEALDAAGYGIILIETVGAGQAEVDIAQAAYTTLLVDAPGLGDGIQAIKAGLMEVADIIAVNKADLPGADNTVKALRLALELGFNSAASSSPISAGKGSEWIPPVLATIATTGEGISELFDAIGQHRQHMMSSGELEDRQRARIRSEMDSRLREELASRFISNQTDGRYEQVLESVIKREISPSEAIDSLIEDYM